MDRVVFSMRFEATEDKSFTQSSVEADGDVICFAGV